MRTTLDIDDEVLLAAKEIARRSGDTAGRVLSALARQALTQTTSATRGVNEPAAFYGQLNSIVIRVSAQKVELLVYGPSAVSQDGRSLRASDHSIHEVEPR